MKRVWILIFLSLPLTAQEVPDSLEQRIKKEVRTAILNYRAWVNPDIPQESYAKYSEYGGHLKSRSSSLVIGLRKQMQLV